MSDEAATTKKLSDGYHVFWEPIPFSDPEAEKIEALLPNGSRLAAVRLLGGRRLGFDRALPKGASLYRRGKLIGTVGQS